LSPPAATVFPPSPDQGNESAKPMHEPINKNNQGGTGWETPGLSRQTLEHQCKKSKEGKIFQWNIKNDQGEKLNKRVEREK